MSDDEKIGRWWNRVRHELCFSGAVTGVLWSVIVRDYNEDLVESIRNVYRTARRGV